MAEMLATARRRVYLVLCPRNCAGSGLYLDYDYLVTGETTKIRENGATSGVGVLATYAYDNSGRRTAVTFGNGVSQAFAYDPVSRLSQLTNNLSGTTNDLDATFAYNPAHQIASVSRSNDAYAWTGHFNENKTATPNGLNQLSSIAGAATAHDGRGNLTFDPTTGRSFGYWSENELVAASGGYGYGHDTFGRIIDTLVNGVVTRQFVYDGPEVVATLTPGVGLTERYVRGDGPDELLVEYSGSGTTNRTWLHQDERGSIVAQSDEVGAAAVINRYDEYGIPGGNGRRFQYTGQAWLSEVGLYYYKNRVYSPTLGRFLQPDPIGYDDSPNLYAYVLNDPVNFVDPLGLQIVVTQCKIGSINIGGEGISRVCVKIDYTPGGGIARAGPGGRSPRGGDGGGGGERPTALRKERLSDKVTDALCEAIGEGNIIPLELITAVAGAAAGVLTDKVVGSSTSEALRRHELRRPVVGSKFLPTEARVAIRGMRAGIIGAAAGLAVGYFFGEEIEEAISDAVASCKKAL